MGKFEASPENVEKSLSKIYSDGFIANYEAIDGGWRVQLAPNHEAIDMTNSLAAHFCMGIELADYLYMTTLDDPVIKATIKMRLK